MLYSDDPANGPQPDEDATRMLVNPREIDTSSVLCPFREWGKPLGVGESAPHAHGDTCGSAALLRTHRLPRLARVQHVPARGGQLSLWRYSGELRRPLSPHAAAGAGAGAGGLAALVPRE